MLRIVTKHDVVITAQNMVRREKNEQCDKTPFCVREYKENKVDVYWFVIFNDDLSLSLSRTHTCAHTHKYIF